MEAHYVRKRFQFSFFFLGNNFALITLIYLKFEGKVNIQKYTL